jgi:hypothetical protein
MVPDENVRRVCLFACINKAARRHTSKGVGLLLDGWCFQQRTHASRLCAEMTFPIPDADTFSFDTKAPGRIAFRYSFHFHRWAPQNPIGVRTCAPKHHAEEWIWHIL